MMPEQDQLAVIQFDDQGVVIAANLAANRLLGYRDGELTGLRRERFLEIEGTEVPAKNIPVNHEKVRAIHKNGDRLSCRAGTVCCPGKQGPASFFMFLSPVEHRAFSVVDSLRESGEHYRMLFRNNPLPMWIYDLDTLRFLEVNEEAVRCYGYSKDEFLTMTILDIRAEEEFVKLKTRVRELKGSGQKTNDEIWKHRKKNGEELLVNIRSSSFQLNGKEARLVLAQDVTKKAMADEALRHSNEKYRLVTQASFDAIWDADLENQTINWGEGFTNIFGHDIGKGVTEAGIWEDNIHPEDRDRVLGRHYHLIRETRETEWLDEYRFIKADGSIALVTDRAMILRDEEGKAYRVVGAMRDITDQRYLDAIHALELNIYEQSTLPETGFQEVIDQLLSGIEQIHTEMHCSVLLLEKNDKVRHLSAPRLSREYLDLIDGLSIGPEEGSCGTAMYRKKPVITENIARDPLWKKYRKTAARFDLKACWSFPVVNREGNVMACFAIYHQNVKSPSEKEWNTITRVGNLLRVLLESHLNVDALRHSNERYDMVTIATHDLIWDWDLETDELYRDPSGIKRVYGMESGQEFKSIQDWLDRVHPDDRERVWSRIQLARSTASEQSFEVEYRFLHQNGYYIHIYDRGHVLFNASGQPYRIIGAAQEITERKNLEQRLLDEELRRQKEISQTMIDTQERERAEIGKELHDNINQVLTTTKLYLELADSDEKMKDELVKRSAENIMKVINEIRQLSRSLMPPSIGDIGLIDSIDDLVESIQITGKLDFRFSPGNLEERMLEDNKKLMVFRIVQEACTNILKHAEAGSASIGMQVRQKALYITIADDGKGFEQSMTRKGNGLNNIKNRVYLFNGSLWINTSPGKGCELVIKIPITI